MLFWRSLCGPYDPKLLVKGTELSVALTGKNSRFAIYEVRSRDADGNADLTYRVRDAETVSDDDVKNGVRPKIVFRSDDLEDCLNFIRKNV